MAEQVDAVVVGMGPAGEDVAGRLAEAGRVRELAGTAAIRPDWAPLARLIRDEATATRELADIWRSWRPRHAHSRDDGSTQQKVGADSGREHGRNPADAKPGRQL